MTKQEFSVIVKAIKAVYPNMLPDDGAKDVWFAMLSDLPYRQVATSLQAHMMSSKYPPTIADLREDHVPKEMSELEAWAMVRKAIRNGSYGAEEEFEKLPPIVQQAVGAPSNLRQWAATDSDMIETVEAHFLKAFRAQQDRAKHDALISPAVKNLIAEIGQKMLEVK